MSSTKTAYSLHFKLFISSSSFKKSSASLTRESLNTDASRRFDLSLALGLLNGSSSATKSFSSSSSAESAGHPPLLFPFSFDRLLVSTDSLIEPAVRRTESVAPFKRSEPRFCARLTAFQCWMYVYHCQNESIAAINLVTIEYNIDIIPVIGLPLEPYCHFWHNESTILRHFQSMLRLKYRATTITSAETE